MTHTKLAQHPTPMFLIRSHTPNQAPTLNAITPTPPDRAARLARRIALCQRLGDLGMELAEAAQREALRDMQPRPERRPGPPGTWMPPSPPTFHSTTLAELFATLCRCVRQSVLLEARLDSPALDHPPPARPPAASREPTEYLRPKQPGDGTSIRHEPLEDDFATEDHRPADEILTDLAQTFGQTLDHPQLPARHRPASAQPGPRPPGPAVPRSAPPPARRPPKPG